MNTKTEITEQIKFLLKFREIGCSQIIEYKNIIVELEKIKNCNESKNQLVTNLNYIKLVYKHKIDIFSEFVHINKLPIKLEKIWSMVTELEKNNTLNKLIVAQNNFLIELDQILKNFIYYCDSIEPPLAEW